MLHQHRPGVQQAALVVMTATNKALTLPVPIPQVHIQGSLTVHAPD